MYRKILMSSLTTGILLALSTGSVFAHSVVKPNTAGIGAFTDFSLGVPSEKDSATTSVRLVLPEGLNFVTPVVKQGWKIEVKTNPVASGAQMPTADDGDVEASVLNNQTSF